MSISYCFELVVRLNYPISDCLCRYRYKCKMISINSDINQGYNSAGFKVAPDCVCVCVIRIFF